MKDTLKRVVAWVSLMNSIALVTNINVESVNAAGNLRIVFLVLDCLDSNLVVCCVYLGKNYLLMRKILVAGTDWEVEHDKKYFLNFGREEMLSSCTGMIEVFRGEDLHWNLT